MKFSRAWLVRTSGITAGKKKLLDSTCAVPRRYDARPAIGSRLATASSGGGGASRTACSGLGDERVSFPWADMRLHAGLGWA
jgi:hypothetical protein